MAKAPRKSDSSEETENISKPPRGKLARRRPRPPRRRRGQVVPVFPLHDTVLFPFTIASLSVDDPDLVQMIDDAVATERLLALVPVEPIADKGKPGIAFNGVGCLGRIVKTLRLPDGTRRMLVRGLGRITLSDFTQTDPYLVAEVFQVPETEDSSPETTALGQAALQQFQSLVAMSPHFPEELRVAAYNIGDGNRLVDLIADTISLSFDEKVQVLSTATLHDRLEIILALVGREEIMMRVGSEIHSKVSHAFAESQREHFLREQLRAIREQLGEDSDSPDVQELRKRMEEANLPGDARAAVEKELERLKSMHPAAADYNVSRTYIDWLLSLPWNVFSSDCLDIAQAKAVLDTDHYDLARVKERILEFLAVLQLKKDMRAPILCFVGPPGVGKTSLGRSIARALGREFVRISLGGVRDEAEIRGHRRTYVGALPGRIIQGLKRAKTANPVFMLDEIDKLGNDFRGDPSSALLEVLDPQQNGTFSDHYLEIPFDLSTILFITTANLIEPIPPALQDRMEVIRIPGYTHNEKCEIARRFLVPRQLKEAGLKQRQLSFYKSALDTIISVYTSESGVRNLEREIGSVCRKHARRLVEGTLSPDQRQLVKGGDVRNYLGPQKLFPDRACEEPRVGSATGMAWTAAGGEIMHIEASLVPGKGSLVLTGSLGEVMKESAQIAYSYVRGKAAEFQFDPSLLEKHDIHVHVPAGATPKDGPSAGTAMAAAITSLLSGRPAVPLVSMTGEITLRGRVLPVGGIKEKVLAASRAGIKHVILPKDNAGDLEEDVPAEITSRMSFHLVEDASEALAIALESVR